jgi:putative transposase
MARPLRIQLKGGWYHVTARRWKGERLYYDKADRIHFLDLLGAMVERYRVRLHAYALMANHFHLLVETPHGNLSLAMQWLNVSYGMWHNRRWKESGPVVQGRYHAVPVDSEGSWALEASRYIHLNPVRLARLGQGKKERRAEASGFDTGPCDEQRRALVKTLRDYRWSSYPAYAGYQRAPEWLECGVLWERAGSGKRAGVEAYRHWLEEEVLLQRAEEAWMEKLATRLALGSEAFHERLRGLAKGNRKEQPDVKRWQKGPGFEDVRRAVEGVKGEKWEAFRDRQRDWGRDVALWLARRHTGLTLPEIAKAAGVADHRAAGKAVERMEKRMREDRELKQIAAQVMKVLSEVGT